MYSLLSKPIRNEFAKKIVKSNGADFAPKIASFKGHFDPEEKKCQKFR